MTTVYVALLMPYYDGSGTVELLGVYTEKKDAEARCYRQLTGAATTQPTSILSLELNKDSDVETSVGPEALDEPSLNWRDFAFLKTEPEVSLSGETLPGIMCALCKTRASNKWWKCCPKHTTEHGSDVMCEKCVLALHSEHKIVQIPADSTITDQGRMTKFVCDVCEDTIWRDVQDTVLIALAQTKKHADHCTGIYKRQYDED